MRIPFFRKAAYDDFPNHDDWFQSFFDLFNPFQESVNLALQSGLTLADNLNAEEQASRFLHGVEKTLTLRRVKTRPVLVLPGYMPDAALARPVAWRYAAGQHVRVTLHFVGEPTAEQRATLWVMGA